MSLFLYLLILIASIALCIVAFLIVSAGDLERYGEVISTPQDLDVYLNVLKARLKEKFQEVDSFKVKVHSRLEQLQKFDSYKKGCIEIQASLVKAEEEARDLQRKIEYYKKVQARVQEDLTPSGGFLGDADWMMGTSRVVM